MPIMVASGMGSIVLAAMPAIPGIPVRAAVPPEMRPGVPVMMPAMVPIMMFRGRVPVVPVPTAAGLSLACQPNEHGRNGNETRS